MIALPNSWRSEEHTSELQSHRDLHSFPTRRSSDLHLGNFYLAGSRLAVEGLPTHVLVNQPRDDRVAQLMDDCRLQVRQRTIHARPRRQALRELSRVLIYQ